MWILFWIILGGIVLYLIFQSGEKEQENDGCFTVIVIVVIVIIAFGLMKLVF